VEAVIEVDHLESRSGVPRAVEFPGTCEVSRGRPTVPRIGFLRRAGVISGLSYREVVANASCPH
jgi:hypothetical protein